ncbi:MAG: hypothetical protein ACR2GA_01380 [Chloroflexota bacterium]
MHAVIRAYVYLAASGMIWLVEGFLFSRYLNLSVWQSIVLAALYLGLLAAAVTLMLRALRRAGARKEGLAAWRALSVAPMLVTIVGSFASLPLILFVVALGKL